MYFFDFLLEYHAGSTFNQTYVQTLKGNTPRKAAIKYAKEKKLRLVKIESVLGSEKEHYRAYFLEKRMFRREREHIYLIKKFQ